MCWLTRIISSKTNSLYNKEELVFFIPNASQTIEVTWESTSRIVGDDRADRKRNASGRISNRVC